jgi:hypothetical protein
VSVGILNEGHLHSALKARYLEPGDCTEVAVEGYIVDILRDGLIVEVQTGNFSKIARKMRDLVSRHRVRLVHPIPRDRWIVRLPQRAGERATRRKSPSHLGAIDVFRELVSFPELVLHENFELDIVLTEEEWIWRFDGRRRWRRRGWALAERRLLQVYETVSLRTSADYAAMLPTGLPAAFVTSDLAQAIGRPRRVAQQAAYCLRGGGCIEKVGSRGNAIVYAKVSRARGRPSS